MYPNFILGIKHIINLETWYYDNSSSLCSFPNYTTLSYNWSAFTKFVLGNTEYSVSAMINVGLYSSVNVIAYDINITSNMTHNRVPTNFLYFQTSQYGSSLWWGEILTNERSSEVSIGKPSRLKEKCCHFDKVLVTSCTDDRHLDNFGATNNENFVKITIFIFSDRFVSNIITAFTPYGNKHLFSVHLWITAPPIALDLRGNMWIMRLSNCLRCCTAPVMVLVFVLV